MSPSPRERRMAAFLETAGWGGAKVSLLAADASFRRYFRASLPGKRAVIMDAPPEHERIEPFISTARHLKALGLSAPEILAVDDEAGFVLIEDLGDDTFTRLVGRGEDEESLYALAVDALIALHATPPERAILDGAPGYTDDLLMTEAEIFTEWYMPQARPGGISRSEADDFAERWRAVFATARGVPDSLVLRDFHVDNLMRLGGRTGIAACGLLDFQDAVAGPITYDFVSLVEDARRDIAQSLASKMRTRYLDAFPDLDAGAFDASCAVLGAQRHCKVIGIFTRLSRRDGKDGYLIHIDRVWRLLEGSLRHPALAPVREWFDGAIPKEQRITPQPEAR